MISHFFKVIRIIMVKKMSFFVDKCDKTDYQFWAIIEMSLMTFFLYCSASQYISHPLQYFLTLMLMINLTHQAIYSENVCNFTVCDSDRLKHHYWCKNVEMFPWNCFMFQIQLEFVFSEVLVSKINIKGEKLACFFLKSAFGKCSKV